MQLCMHVTIVTLVYFRNEKKIIKICTKDQIYYPHTINFDIMHTKLYRYHYRHLQRMSVADCEAY